jgi:prepilin-type N-terminal cleavage/methylation domain-containing protein
LRAGFTLLEILIAVTIMGIVTLAVYTTFRAGLNSYESGREQMAVTQTARVVFDMLARDLRALYYLEPKKYNQLLIQRLQLRTMSTLQLPPAGRRPRRPGGGPVDGGEGEEERPIPGIPIDLTILGTEGEGGDALTFVAYQPHWGTAPVAPWALARVKYFVEDGSMYRAEGPVAVDEVPSFQWQPPPPVDGTGMPLAPEVPGGPDLGAEADVNQYLADVPRELVARNVKQFDLLYGYWGEEGWFEASDWAAHERRYRNPPMELDPEDPMAQAIRHQEMQRPTDDIPAYVVVTLALSYGRDNERVRVFRSRIRLFGSLESFEPFIDPALGVGVGGPGARRPTARSLTPARPTPRRAPRTYPSRPPRR